MNDTLQNTFVCPYSKQPLKLQIDKIDREVVVEGKLETASGKTYKIENGVPFFFDAADLSTEEIQSQNEYDAIVAYYDNAIEWLFGSFYEDEAQTRNSMVDDLELKKSSRVLEVACGTGRDSRYIGERLGAEGEFHLQDISEQMVLYAAEKVSTFGFSCPIHFSVSSANALPYPDDYFDALYTFGGFNEFRDPAGAQREFSRVVKTGGKIVFGDEHIAPWLEDSEYAEIIKVNNPIFRRTAFPVDSLPDNSKEVNVRWVIGSCFYLIDYRVGESAPQLNLDLPHKGWRGGSLRTRYYGQLEGVSPELKEQVISAAKKSGLSVVDWLEKNLKTLT